MARQLEDWEKPGYVKPQFIPAKPRTPEEQAVGWAKAQAEYERLKPKPGLVQTVSGAFNTIAPKASLLIGGEDESFRRGSIADKYPLENKSNLPIRPQTIQINKEFIPSPAEEAARRVMAPVNTITRPGSVASIKRGTGVAEAPMTEIQSRISPENPYGADVVGGNMRTGQIGVGAATDEEAARNLQSRAEQDAAVADTVSGINRATEALRDLRAERRGIPRTALDVAEGRVEGQEQPTVGQSGEKFGDDVLARDRFLRQFQAPSGSSRKAVRLAQANMINAQEAWDQNQQALRTPPAVQKPTVNPLDVQRFLLDRQKFNWQQGVDKGRLTIDQAKAQSDLSNSELNKVKYKDESRKLFMDNFAYPDEGAPREQLGSLVLSLSESTDGKIPPELMTRYVKAAADEAKVDWEDAPPKSLTALGKRAMQLAVEDYR